MCRVIDVGFRHHDECNTLFVTPPVTPPGDDAFIHSLAFSPQCFCPLLVRCMHYYLFLFLVTEPREILFGAFFFFMLEDVYAQTRISTGRGNEISNQA